MHQHMELVVAHYRENLAWLNGWQGVPPVVYHKAAGAIGRQLPNIGREAHTYLHHILDRYDSLPRITVFLQGNPFDHVPDILEKLALLDENCRFRQFSDHLIVEDREGYPSHPGVPFADFYEALFGSVAPDFIACRTAACMAVSADTIRAYPKEFYALAQCLTTGHEFGAHAMERLWQHVFHRVPESEGIVTASDAGFFHNLRFLILSLQRWSRYPVAIVDLGMTDPQRKWLSTFPNLTLVKVPLIDKWIEPIRQEHWWQTWLKPFYIQSAPFDRVLWIDADCIVVGPLEEAFEQLQHAPILVADRTPADTRNKPRLYRHLPLPADHAVDSVSVNAGVIGLCRIRDRALLDAWSWGVQWAAHQPTLRHLVAYADQGLLQWALANTNRAHLVRADPQWNFPCRHETSWSASSKKEGVSLLEAIRRGHPGASIVHWYGQYKLSMLLLNELSEDFASE